MIATRDLRELATFSAEKGPVLSLYLDTDLSRQLKEQVKLVLRGLLEKARAEGAQEEDLQRVSRFVDFEYDWQSKGLVVFSCQADALWQFLHVPVTLRSRIMVSDEAYLLPLANVLDHYAPYGVALIDQEGARLFLVDIAGIVQEEEAMGEPIKRQKQGGWSATRFQRNQDQRAAHNMRAAAEALTRFCESNGCPRLILGGTDENTARFRELLPVPVRQTVVGTMPVDMTANRPEIVERSRQILNEVEEQREHDLVQQVITLAAGGRVAVTGLADTLFALQEGRVLTLLIEEGFAAPGLVCRSCDYLSIDETERCLFCGTAEARPVANVVERAVHKAMLQGAKIEVITNEPALAKAGHIGALLRY